MTGTKIPKHQSDAMQPDLPLNSGEGTPPSSAPAGRVVSDDFLNKGNRQEIFIPVSGFVWLYPEEISVINHPAFQRLSRIYQLGQTYLVYRGATHKRFEHSVGTVHVIQRMIDALQNTHQKSVFRGGQGTAPMLVPAEQRFVRLGALLHDIGHLPAGHTIEDELCLTGKHDHDERLDGIFSGEFDPPEYEEGNLGALIDRLYGQFVPESLGVTASVIVRLLIRKHPNDAHDPHLESFGKLKESSAIRMNICRDMIGNTICADILDYIYRDWYHLGKPRPFDERILQYLELRGTEKDIYSQPVASPSDRIVVSLGRRPKIRTDAVSSILELLESRYQLAESVLFHRTKLCAAAMLDRALFELWGDEEPGSDKALEKLLMSLSDEQLISKCEERAKELSKNPKTSSGKKQRCELASKLFSALENRQLFTSLCTFTFDELPTDIHGRIQECYGKSADGKVNTAPLNRNRALRMLEADFSLQHGSLALYCPTAGMNAKIAQVQIAVGDQIAKFSEYEQKFGAGELSGGHLSAQLERFRRLWRVHFFISRSEKQRLEAIDTGLVATLRRAAQQLVLKHLSSHETDEVEVVRNLARQLAHIDGSHRAEQELRTGAEIALAAKSDPSQSMGSYPSGMISVSSAFRPHE